MDHPTPTAPAADATTAGPVGSPPPGFTPVRDHSAPESRRGMIIELMVVIALAILPDLGNAIFSLMLEPTSADNLVQSAAIMLRSVQVAAVVLYLIWRSPEGFAGFGLKTPRPIVDLALGLGLALGAFASHYVVWGTLWQIPGLIELYQQTASAQDSGYAPPSTPTEIAAMVAMSIANGFAEQLVISAYLITRLKRLTGSTPLAVLLASVLFTSYHVYYGFWALPSILVGGLLYGTVFALCRRLWPLVIGHAAYDIAVVLTS